MSTILSSAEFSQKYWSFTLLSIQHTSSGIAIFIYRSCNTFSIRNWMWLERIMVMQNKWLKVTDRISFSRSLEIANAQCLWPVFLVFKYWSYFKQNPTKAFLSILQYNSNINVCILNSTSCIKGIRTFFTLKLSTSSWEAFLTLVEIQLPTVPWERLWFSLLLYLSERHILNWLRYIF